MASRFGSPPPFDRLETTRLVLRPYDAADLAAVRLAEDRSRAHLAPYMPWASGEPLDDAAFAQKLRGFRSLFDRGEEYVVGAFERTTGELVGSAGLHPRVGAGGIEIGYWVDVAHLRQGHAVEMAGALTRVALETLGLRFVEIRTAASNVASQAVAKRLGYRLEATLARRVELPGGDLEDLLVFTLFAEQLATAPAGRVRARAHLAGKGWVLGGDQDFASI